jgi:hypothetical protein
MSAADQAIWRPVHEQPDQGTLHSGQLPFVPDPGGPADLPRQPGRARQAEHPVATEPVHHDDRHKKYQRLRSMKKTLAAWHRLTSQCPGSSPTGHGSAHPGRQDDKSCFGQDAAAASPVRQSEACFGRPGERRDLLTLPPTIARLARVKRLVLYGSPLVRIPPEIGATPYQGGREIERSEPW